MLDTAGEKMIAKRPPLPKFFLLIVTGVLLLAAAAGQPALGQQPLKIGFSMALTGVTDFSESSHAAADQSEPLFRRRD